MSSPESGLSRASQQCSHAAGAQHTAANCAHQLLQQSYRAAYLWLTEAQQPMQSFPLWLYFPELVSVKIYI